MLPVSKTMYSPPSTNTSSRMWPANMFANNRRLSETGRTRMFEMNSIGIISGISQTGTPAGMVWCLK